MYRQNLEFLFKLSSGEKILGDSDYDACCTTLQPTMVALQKTLAGKSKDYPFVSLPSLSSLRELMTVAGYCRRRFERVVFVGLGAATSCGMALASLGMRRTPHLEVIDNIDSQSIAARMAHWDYGKTGYVLISRSGETMETLEIARSLWLSHKSMDAREDFASSFIGLCGSLNSSLANFCRDHGIRCIKFDPEVSGRFSILQGTGLFPSMVADLDVKAFLEGAMMVLKPLQDGVIASEFPPAMAAAALSELKHHGCRSHVLFSYSDTLVPFTAWLSQLYAESLGKDGEGFTPIVARGTSDEHSQLQLWCDGPKDKFFTIFARELVAGASHLLSLDAALDSHWRATRELLVEKGNAVRLMTWKVLDEKTMGALAMQSMLEVFFLSALWQVNAFDEPAVRGVKEKANDLYRNRMGLKALENG